MFVRNGTPAYDTPVLRLRGSIALLFREPAHEAVRDWATSRLGFVRHAAGVLTVARLLHTPVKSLCMGHVDALELGPNGVVDDRIFYLVDDNNQSLNQARRSALTPERVDRIP